MDIVTLALAKNYTKEAVGGLWDRWDSTVSYAKGQIVLYNGIPYQAKQTTTAGTWVASEWQQINISDALEKIDEKVDKPIAETYTIASSDWTALASSAPFTYSTTVTATHTIGNDTVCELANDQAVLFATYGFAIGAVSGQSVTIYSIGQPSASVTLEVDYYG